jgi:WD40 repeat protein
MAMKLLIAAVAAGLLITIGTTGSSDVLAGGAPDAPIGAVGQATKEPAGLIARLGTTQYRTSKHSVGLGFLADGRTLVETTADGWLQYWDSASGSLTRSHRFAQPGVSVRAAAQTPDGSLIAICAFHFDEEQRKNDGWIELLDAKTGAQQLRFPFEDSVGERVAISPDGHTIVGDGRTKLRVVDVGSATEVVARNLDQNSAQSLCFSPDGQMLAMGTSTKLGNLLLWKWTTTEEPHWISLGSDRRRVAHVLSVAFAPDGASLAAGLDGQNEGVVLIDLASGGITRRFSVEGVSHLYPRRVVFSSDGKHLAASIDYSNSGGGVALWDAASGKLVHRLEVPYGSMESLAFSQNGRLLAGAGGFATGLGVWNVATGERLGRELPGHAASPSIVRFFPGDKQLATSGDDGTIRLWDVANSRPIRVITPERSPNKSLGWIRELDVSPDGNYVLSSSLDDTVRLWEASTGREVYRLPGHGRLGGRRAVRFTSDSKRFASWGDDLQAYLWDVATGAAVAEYRGPSGTDLPAGPRGALAMVANNGWLSPDASRLLVTSTGNGYIFDTATGKELAKFSFGADRTMGLAISTDNRRFLYSSLGSPRRIPMQGGNQRITASKTHLVELRDLSDGQVLRQNELTEGLPGVIALPPDGTRAAICVRGDRSRVVILRVPELDQVAEVECALGLPQAVEFSHSGKLLAVSLADTTVAVLDLDQLPDIKQPSPPAKD